MPVANEGLAWDSILKMVHNPGGDWQPGWGVDLTDRCVYMPQAYAWKITTFTKCCSPLFSHQPSVELSTY